MQFWFLFILFAIIAGALIYKVGRFKQPSVEPFPLNDKVLPATRPLTDRVLPTTRPVIDAHGHLISGFFIFFRGCQAYSDTDILDRFGLSEFERAEAAPRAGLHVILADAGEWTVLADNLFYLLWHMRTTRPAIDNLGSKCDVFACTIGDANSSFDFVYYRNGTVVREYAYVEPMCSKGRGEVVIDFGKPLSGESEALKPGEIECETAMQIPASLGIKTEFKESDLRIYVAPDHFYREYMSTVHGIKL